MKRTKIEKVLAELDLELVVHTTRRGREVNAVRRRGYPNTVIVIPGSVESK